jgi:hypothetical protein
MRERYPGANCRVERNQTQRRDNHQRRRTNLQPEPRQQEEPGDQAAAHGARRVCEIQQARALADGELRVLDECVAKRKAESHQQRRQHHSGSMGEG